MAWITPKTDWLPPDGIDNEDFNRVEGNIAFIAKNPVGGALQLAPDGGSVLIGKDESDGVGKLQISGSITFDNSSPDIGITGTDSGRLVLSGDADETAGGNIILRGSNNATPDTIDLRSGTTLALRVESSGNILLGLTDDNTSFILQTAGSIGITTTNVSQIKMFDSSTDERCFIEMENEIYIGKVSSDISMRIGSSSVSDEVLRIKGATGNILVNSSVDNLAHKLQVEGSISSDGINLGGELNPTTTPAGSSWNLTTTPMIIPRGIYSVVGDSSSDIYQYSGGVWRLFHEGSSDNLGTVVVSDGVSFRIQARSGTSTARYWKF